MVCTSSFFFPTIELRNAVVALQTLRCFLDMQTEKFVSLSIFRARFLCQLTLCIRASFHAGISWLPPLSAGNPAADIVPRLRLFFDSLSAPIGPGAWLHPVYGTSGLSQGFCRYCRWLNGFVAKNTVRRPHLRRRYFHSVCLERSPCRDMWRPHLRPFSRAVHRRVQGYHALYI